MAFSLFLRKFLAHVAGAATVLCAILVIGEYFAPGSVLPFIDLVDGSLIVLVLDIAAIVAFRTDTPES